MPAPCLHGVAIIAGRAWCNPARTAAGSLTTQVAFARLLSRPTWSCHVCLRCPASSLQEIDRLLSGGAALGQPDPWGFSAATTYNAFAESSTQAGTANASADTSFPVAAPSEASTPRWGVATAGSGDWGGAGAASPGAAAAGNDWFGGVEAAAAGQQAQQSGGGGAAKVIGTGTVLHTFVGDYNQPEELSVFEGDKVGAVGGRMWVGVDGWW